MSFSSSSRLQSPAHIGATLTPYPKSIDPALLNELSLLSGQTFVHGEVENARLTREDIKRRVCESLSGIYGRSNFEAKLEKEIRKFLSAKPRIVTDTTTEPRLNIQKQIYSICTDFFFRRRRELIHLELTAEKREQLKAEILNPDSGTSAGNNLERAQIAKNHAQLLKDGVLTINSAIERFFIALEKTAIYDYCELAVFRRFSSKLPSGWQARQGAYKSQGGIWSFVQHDPAILKAAEAMIIEELKHEIRGQLQAKSSVSNRLTPLTVSYSTQGHISYSEPSFQGLNASWIPGSHFIASAGPRDLNEAVRVFKDIILAEAKEHPPVTDIIALGNCIQSNNAKLDFIDYFNLLKCKPGEVKATKYKDSVSDIYHIVDVKMLSYSDEYKVDANQDYPQGMIQAEVWVREFDANNKMLRSRQINYLLLAVPDNEVLNLENEQKYPKLKELMIQVAERSAKGSVLVHCRGGLGRTGNVIATIEIFKNMAKFFESGEVLKIFDKCREVLGRIRQGRPTAVWVAEQEISAIFNAALLNGYLLELRKSPAAKGAAAMFAGAVAGSNAVDNNMIDVSGVNLQPF